LHHPITIILLLGSYDPQTKSCLELVKEEIVKSYSGENLYAFLLDTVETYDTDKFTILVERLNKKVTIFVFHQFDSRLIDVEDVKIEKDLDETVYTFLKNKYDIKKTKKTPIFKKFDIMMRISQNIIVLRDKEETRGGEYLELLHAIFQNYSDKIWFFRRDGIQLSAMLMEYLDNFRIKIRSYNSEKNLLSSVMRVLGYEISKLRNKTKEKPTKDS